MRTRSRAHAKCVCTVIIYCHRCIYCCCCCCWNWFIVWKEVLIFYSHQYNSSPIDKIEHIFMVKELVFIKFTNHLRIPKKNYIGFIHPFLSPEKLVRNGTEFYKVFSFFFRITAITSHSLTKRMESWIFFPNYIKKFEIKQMFAIVALTDWLTEWLCEPKRASVKYMQFILLC